MCTECVTCKQSKVRNKSVHRVSKHIKKIFKRLQSFISMFYMFCPRLKVLIVVTEKMINSTRGKRVFWKATNTSRRTAKWAATTLRATSVLGHKVRLTPSIDVAISRVCAVMRGFAISVLYGSNLCQIYRVDSGHTVSLLARSSQHYLVVASVFFEVQLARTRSQSDSCIHGRGFKSANERADHRQKHQKPRRQSSVCAASGQTVIQDTIWCFFFF